VHISELAQHHVENPREIIQPGDPVRVKILEIDSERRRLSLSIKRVEGQVLPVRPIVPPEGDAADLDHVPELGLSEDVFASEAEAEESADLQANVDTPAPAEAAEAPAEATEAPAEAAEAPAEATEAPAEDADAQADQPDQPERQAEAGVEAPAAEQPRAADEPESAEQSSG